MEFWAQRVVSPLDERESWTIVDDRYVEQGRAGEYLRFLVDRGGSVGTARTYSGRLALWLGWVAEMGVDEAAPNAEQLARFARWLERSLSRSHRRGADRRLASAGEVVSLRAARSLGTVDGVVAVVVEFVRFGVGHG